MEEFMIEISITIARPESAMTRGAKPVDKIAEPAKPAKPAKPTNLTKSVELTGLTEPTKSVELTFM
ncbi:hypothetical protein [Cohnella fermenti]|uniref:Uncharacterized protein n=1 Tax=Cohnella fermenti TaxID=2565925 RepID=A0A4S4C3C3_9BACL|nr:hypothetical protein [Cohnella fermenti]THF82236.1 hypothetical protein E6C55_07590 [Cohnella fermenti]